MPDPTAEDLLAELTAAVDYLSEMGCVNAAALLNYRASSLQAQITDIRNTLHDLLICNNTETPLRFNGVISKHTRSEVLAAATPMVRVRGDSTRSIRPPEREERGLWVETEEGAEPDGYLDAEISMLDMNGVREDKFGSIIPVRWAQYYEIRGAQDSDNEWSDGIRSVIPSLPGLNRGRAHLTLKQPEP